MPAAPGAKMMEYLVARLAALPLLSPVAVLLDDVLRDPRTMVEEVAQIVAQDPPIAMRMIRAVNSAYYGLPEPLTDLHRAIRILGFDAVQEIARQPSLLQLFAIRRPEDAPFNVRMEGLWQHAIATGVAARILWQRQESGDALPAFTVGLLHDVGKAALLLLWPDMAERALALARTERLSLVMAERRLLPFDHAQLGRALCQVFGQPEAIAFAVGRHHNVRSGARDEACSVLAAIAHVADILARALGAGWWGDHVMPRLDLAARVTLSLQGGDARALLDAVEVAYPQALITLRNFFPARVAMLPAARH
jgi:HD-like signal output (HDOD) protein